MPLDKIARKIQEQPLAEEMKSSYLDYAMSVIVSRALPDVRDGLKPVHRRILYAMWNLGLKSGAKFRKSATVVGEVLGKYHPHGEAAVYDSLVRMAQDFSLRYPLIWGQGNFGSVDGDSPAAMRYTEAKLTPIAEEMLFDLEKDTVDFVPNYDNSQKEPKVLPAKLPNLLLNGSMGIAVGMATNIPPHNLSEVCQALIYLIDNPEATTEDLMKFIKGPDFPTGGIIFDKKQIKQAYATGKGGIVIRAKADIVEYEAGKFQIVVTELPYQVNKAALLEKIANLVKEGRLEGIKDIRDESDKEGLRVVIDLKKDSYPQKILNKLFKLTQLQDVFYVNSIALTEEIQPRLLTLKSILQEYIKHRQEVIRRRTEFDLRKAEERAHILKGLKIAVDNINEVIKLIKSSKDKEEAKIRLIKRFKLTEIQAAAILEIRLHQLAHLEVKKIEDELKEKLRLIKEYKIILSHPKKILAIIKEELTELDKKYGDERRTKVVSHPVNEFKQEDLIPDEPCVITLTRSGYIKRLSPEIFKTQSRGGKGVIGLSIKEEDEVEHLLTTTTHSSILFFTTSGRVFQLKAYDVPQSSRTAKGQAIVNFLQIQSGEKISAVLSLKELANQKFLIMVTEMGLVKKVKIDSFIQVRRSGLIAIKLKGEDKLQWVKASSGKDEVILTTAQGKSIRFKEKDIRPMSRSAAGVRGIRLKKGDKVVGMDIIKNTSKKGYLLVVTENGFGKKTKISLYKVQKRGGTGIKTAKTNQKTGELVASLLIDETPLSSYKKGDIIIISSLGQVIRIPLKAVPILGRDTQGVRLMRFKEKTDKVASITLV